MVHMPISNVLYNKWQRVFRIAVVQVLIYFDNPFYCYAKAKIRRLAFAKFNFENN